MKLQIVVVVAAMLALVTGVRAAESGPQTLLTMRVDSDITIDAQGQVTRYKVTTPVTPTIEKALDKAVHGWRFQPVTVDGQPANARSGMRVTLAAREASDGYAISVDNVTFRDIPKDEPLGPGEVRAGVRAPARDAVRLTIKSRRAVKYPRAAERAGIDGAVLLYVEVGEDGSAVQVFPVQSTLYNIRASARVMSELREAFEDNAVSAIKHWRFDVQLNGARPTPENMSGTMRVEYETSHTPAAGSPGQWRMESRSAWRQAPWLVGQRTAQKINVSDVAPGEMMQVASAFHPPDGVIGKAL